MRCFLEYFQEIFDNFTTEKIQHDVSWESKYFNFKMDLIWFPYIYNFDEMEVSKYKNS
jgi:hypothetical protein